MARHGRAGGRSAPPPGLRLLGCAARWGGSVSSGRDLRGLHAHLRGPHRPPAAPGLLPRGRRPGHPPAAHRRRVRARPDRAAGPDRLQPAVGVLAGGGHSRRAQVAEAAARGARPPRTKTSWSGGRSATSCWPDCSSAGPTPPRPTSSWPWPSRPPRSVPREVGLADGFAVHAPDLLAGITPDDLAQAYLRGRGRAPGAPGRPLPRHRRHGLGGRGGLRADRHAGGAGPARSARWCEDCTTRIEVIVRFLALLELCKMGQRRARDRGRRSATCRSRGWPPTNWPG